MVLITSVPVVSEAVGAELSGRWVSETATLSQNIIVLDANDLKHRIFIFLCHNHNHFNKSNMSNRADEPDELFYNAAESIINNAILLDEDATVLDEFHGFLVGLNVLDVGCLVLCKYNAKPRSTSST